MISNLKNNRNKNFIKYSISTITILIIIISSFFHEIWRDEGHFIQMAKEMSLYDLIIYFRVEGIFPSYPIILKTLYLFIQNEILVLKLFNILFYLLAFYILLKSKVPFHIIILLILSFPFFQYGLINRYYIVLVPIISYLTLYEKKKDVYKHLSYFTLASIGILGLIILFCFLISNLKEFKKDILRHKVIYSLIFIISLISLYYAMPYEGREWNKIDLNYINIYALAETYYNYFFSNIFIYNFFQNFDVVFKTLSSQIIVNFLIYVFIGFFFLTLLRLFLTRQFNLLILLLSSFVIFLVFFSITSHHTFRHYFIFTSIFYLVIIKSIYIDKDKYQFNLTSIENFFKYYKYLFFFVYGLFLILIFSHYNEKIVSNTVSNFYLIVIFTFLLITILNLYLRKNYKMIYILSIVFLIITFLFSTSQKLNYDIFFLLLSSIYLLNFYLFFYKKDKFNLKRLKLIDTNSILKKVIFLILIVSSICSVSFAYKEIRYPFSNSKQLANYFNDNDVKCEKISSADGWDVGAWVPYMKQENCKIHQIKTGRISGYWDNNFYDRNNFFSINFKDINLEREYTILNCYKSKMSKICIKDEKLIRKNLDQQSFKYEIILFNDETIFQSGEKFLVIKIIQS